MTTTHKPTASLPLLRHLLPCKGRAASLISVALGKKNNSNVIGLMGKNNFRSLLLNSKVRYNNQDTGFAETTSSSADM